MPFSTNVIKLLEEVDPPLRKVLIAILEEIERQRETTVTKKEFLEFAHQTEENFKKVWQVINELAEAQKRTEQRVEELAEAQKRTEREVSDLKTVVEELAEAQKRTEREVSDLKTVVRELAEAQKRTEQRVEELAEAQKRTEEELKKLVGEHKKTKVDLGGLQHTVGYVLEDRAYVGLPKLLKEDFGVELTEPLRREYIEVSPGNYKEVNIIGRGRRNGEQVWIIGECKSQIKKKEIDDFLKLLKSIDEVLPGKKIPVVVTYQASPPVREYIKQKGMKLYFSYQFPLVWL
jgi:myosin heavy subunit